MALIFDEALLPDGWARQIRVDIRDGLIAAVQTDAAAIAGDERHAIGLPGMTNLHSHAFQRGMAGRSETRGDGPDSFWTWRALMYRFLDRMDPDDMQAVAAQAYVEMLESGFTRVCEFHYLHHQPDGRPYDDIGEMGGRIAAAAAQAGIGLTLLPCFYAHGGFGAAPALPGQRRFLNDLDSFATLLAAGRTAAASVPGARVGIAPHSLRAVTPDELQALAEMSPATPLHIHVAEQPQEVEDCLAWSGRRPVAWLLDHLPLDPRWCLIHATHMTPDEAARLARTGAVAGLCPITEANLGDGIFDAVTWMEAGGRSGIGTDSNVLIGVAAELRQMEYAQRLQHRARNVLADAPGRSTGRSLFDQAVAGGAQAAGLPAHGIRPGAAADLVGLDADHPALLGGAGDALLDQWIFAAARPAVQTVWAHGRKCVIDGRHVARDAVARRFRTALHRLLG